METMSSLGGLLADYGSDSDSGAAEGLAERGPPSPTTRACATQHALTSGGDNGVVAESAAEQATGSGSEKFLGALPEPKNPTKRLVRFTLPIDPGFLKEAVDEVQAVATLSSLIVFTTLCVSQRLLVFVLPVGLG